VQRPAPVLRAIKRKLSDLLGPGSRPATPDPLVSIVIPVYNVERYLAECLDSVLAQTYRRLQVVVINDGSTDASAKIATRYARSDSRIVYRQQPNAGLGATRNAAVRVATGEYLFFLDSDDRLPHNAIQNMVAAATQHSADIVMGPLSRFNSTRAWVPKWAQELHSASAYFDALSERPQLLRNLYACAKLYRRDFWDAQQATFREGVAYEDQPVVTQLMLAARGIVSLAEPVYSWRLREDFSSISQQTHTLADVSARVQAWDVTAKFLAEADAPSEIRGAWLGTVYGTHLHWYLTSDSIEQPEYWQILHKAVNRLADCGQSTLPIPAARALALELLAADDHLEYLRLRRLGAFDPDRQRLQISGAQLWWRPVLSDPQVKLERVVEWSAVPSSIRFVSAVWDHETGNLDVGIEHHLDGLDLAGLAVEQWLELRGADEGHLGEVRGDADPREASGASAFRASVPAALLADLPVGAVRLVVRSSYGELSRSDELPVPAKWHSASRLPAAVHHGVLVVSRTSFHRAELDVRRPTAWLAAATRAGSAVQLRVAAAAGAEINELRLGEGGARIPVVAGQAALDESVLARFEATTRTGKVPVLATLAGGGTVALVSSRPDLGVLRGRLELTTDPDGAVLLVAHQAYAEAVEVSFGGEKLVVTLRTYLRSGWSLKSLEFASRQTSVEARRASDGTWTVPLVGLPIAGYYLVAEFGGPGATRRVRIAAAPSFVDAVASTHILGELRWRTLVAPTGAAHVDCRAVSGSAG
jgi:glycosyltransferase involved in cell wall biosynthesis